MSRYLTALSQIRLVLLPVVLAAATACQKPAPSPTAIANPRAAAPAASVTPARPTDDRQTPATSATSAPAPATKSSETGADAGRAKTSELVIRRLEVAGGVKDREPIAEAPVRAGKDKVYAFIDLANTSDAPAELVVTFERAGAPSTGHVTLVVPARQARFRTWAFTRGIRTPGEWTARVRTADGAEVASKRFSVEAASAQGPTDAPSEA